MAAHRIAGLDIGTFAVKVVVVELQRNLEVVAYREIDLAGHGNGLPQPGMDGVVDDDGDQSAGAQEMFPEPGDDGGEPGAGDDWAQGQGQPAEQGSDEWTDGETASEDPASEQAEPGEDGGTIAPWAMALARLEQEGFFDDVNQIITSFPDGEAVTLHLEVPFERPRDVEEILPHLLMDELPISLGEVIYDFIVVPGEEPDVWEALVGFVERTRMGAFLDQCRFSGVEPAVVGVPELMLRYAGDQAVDPGVESYGIIDIGHQFTRLLIMSNGKPVVVHTTRKGGAAVTEALAENFQIPMDQARQLKHREGVVGDAARGGDRRVRQISGTIEEALRPVVRDLRRTFQSAYAKYQVAVDAIYVCGGTSRLQGLEGFLQREFQVDVQPLRFDRSLIWSVDAQSRERTPEAALAVANALQRSLDDSDRNLVDFRQEEFVFRGKSSYLHQQMVRYGAVGALLVLMLIGVLVMQHYDQRAQLQAMQQAVAEQTEELFGDPVTSAPEIQARLEGEAVADRDFVPRMSAYELMYRIVEKTGRNIPLELDRIEVDTDRSLVQLMGETDSPQSVDVLAGQIEELDCLSNVRKDQVNVRSDDEVQFELQISSGCS